MVLSGSHSCVRDSDRVVDHAMAAGLSPADHRCGGLRGGNRRLLAPPTSPARRYSPHRRHGSRICCDAHRVLCRQRPPPSSLGQTPVAYVLVSARGNRRTDHRQSRPQGTKANVATADVDNETRSPDRPLISTTLPIPKGHGYATGRAVQPFPSPPASRRGVVWAPGRNGQIFAAVPTGCPSTINGPRLSCL